MTSFKRPLGTLDAQLVQVEVSVTTVQNRAWNDQVTQQPNTGYNSQRKGKHHQEERLPPVSTAALLTVRQTWQVPISKRLNQQKVWTTGTMDHYAVMSKVHSSHLLQHGRANIACLTPVINL